MDTTQNIKLNFSTTLEQPENSVFEGGGVKAIAYGGALLVLEQVGWLQGLKRHLGTSAGAISATMLALGYGAKDIIQFSLDTDFTSFEDGWFAKNIWREFEYYGYYSGDNVLEALRTLVEQKLGDKNATFADLAQQAKTNSALKELYVITTNFSRRTCVTMSHESQNYKNVPIALAVRASMSFPTIFEPVHMENKDKRIDLHVDGGLQNNFDLIAFDQERYTNPNKPNSHQPMFNPKTLGLRLDSTYDYQQYDQHEDIYIPIDSFKGFVSTLLSDVLNEQKTLYRDHANAKRIIAINVGEVSTADFTIDRKTRLMLIKNGAKAAATFLNNLGIQVDMKAINEMIHEFEQPSQKNTVAAPTQPVIKTNKSQVEPFIMSHMLNTKPTSPPLPEKNGLMTYLWNMVPSWKHTDASTPIQMSNTPEESPKRQQTFQ